MSRKFHFIPLFVFLYIISFSNVNATLLDLKNYNETTGIYPNVMLTIDDSSSMKTSEFIANNPVWWPSQFYWPEGGPLYNYPNDWRRYTEIYNHLYYDTKKTYKPWNNR